MMRILEILDDVKLFRLYFNFYFLKIILYIFALLQMLQIILM
jgi:hypothetical protein